MSENQSSQKSRIEKSRYKAPLENFYKKLRSPIGDFIGKQTSGGIVLMFCVIIAMFLANSRYEGAYKHFFETPIAFQVGSFELAYTLHHWINDGLMAMFFFVVGLEIKRELLVGELSSPSKAALPIIAALGGMIVPALIYYAFNVNSDAVHGWGVPMATDIAFAVGVVVLLGNRVPQSVVTFLLALAIADDLGAVLVISLFYTSTISTYFLYSAFALLGVMVLMNLLGVRRPLAYFCVGLPLWAMMLQSGVHATVAGVLAAFTIPTLPRYEPSKFSKEIHHLIHEFDRFGSNKKILASHAQSEIVEQIELAADAVSSPLRHLEHGLHSYITFFILPVFALANAGVHIDASGIIDAFLSPITLGVIFGLVAGKLIGIAGFTFLAVKIGIGKLPEGATMNNIVGVALLGGIGFTMSIFVAELAFKGVELHLIDAKIGILAASLLAGLSGYFYLKATSNPESEL